MLPVPKLVHYHVTRLCVLASNALDKMFVAGADPTSTTVIVREVPVMEPTPLSTWPVPAEFEVMPTPRQSPPTESSTKPPPAPALNPELAAEPDSAAHVRTNPSSAASCASVLPHAFSPSLIVPVEALGMPVGK